MSGILDPNDSAKSLFPGIKSHFVNLYENSPADWSKEFSWDMASKLSGTYQKPTRWERFKEPFQEAAWRMRVAYSLLSKGRDSKHYNYLSYEDEE